MSSEQSRALARRVTEEIFNQGKLNVVDELFTPDFVEHNLPPGYPQGSAGFRQWVADLRQAFPDFHFTIEDFVGEGGKFAVRITAQGTFKGRFMGMAPTGKQAVWSEVHLVRVAGDRCAEAWGVVDQLGMLQQLGVIPARQPLAV
jgi:predicted ester cyclase